MDSSERTAEEIRGYGRDCLCVPTDISLRPQVESLIAQCLQRYGGIDILVNNAGVVIFGSLIDCRLEDWSRMLSIDLTGALHCTQLVARHMIERKRGGRMIHIGSTASLYPTSQQGAYSVAKAGLGMLSATVAMELAPQQNRITSNLLCPEGAVTDINRELLRDPETMAELEGRIPLGRLSTTEEIAAAAAYLASDEAAYMTGTEMVHDGGVTKSSLWWR